MPLPHFDGWPILHAKIEPGDGRGNPEISRAIHRAQESAYLVLCALKYQSVDKRRLTAADKRAVRVTYSIEAGCTDLKIDFTEVLKELVRTKVPAFSRKHVVLTALAAAAILASPQALSSFFSYQIEMRKADMEEQKITLHAQAQRELFEYFEKRDARYDRHFELLIATSRRDETGLTALAGADLMGVRPALLMLAPTGGSVTINGVTVHAAAAQPIAKKLEKQTRAAKRQFVETKVVPPSPWITTTTRAVSFDTPPMRLGRPISS